MACGLRGSDALGELTDQEADAERESNLVAHGSLAVAYVYLLRRFDNNMSAVAGYLRISQSHAYRCYAYAKYLAAHMTHIPAPAIEKFMPGPWRRFRLSRSQVQLAFDFDEELLI